MKENKYDDEIFFDKYSRMPRSLSGLQAAGEWHELQKMLPDFTDKRVLDLGCGFGWHCRYAVEHGAKSVTGIDISEKMLEKARRETVSDKVAYLCMPIEDYDYPAGSFEVVISSLAFHYVESFRDICANVYRTLVHGGVFVFSMEHPVFTAQGTQDWFYAADGSILHWPVDRYFTEGRREAEFLGEKVTKYHHTMTTVVTELLAAGFTLTGLVEPEPSARMLDEIPGMRDELRRPMMLLISAVK